MKLSNKFFIIFVSHLAISACAIHYPSIHLYDGAEMDEQKLAALWYSNEEPFLVDGHYSALYLPEKPYMRKQIVDEYLILPGEREFVFAKKVRIGFKTETECSADYTYCPPKDEYCVPVAYRSCEKIKKPEYLVIFSEKIILELKASHKYFITTESKVMLTEKDTISSKRKGIGIGQATLVVKTRDLGKHPERDNPNVTNLVGGSTDYYKIARHYPLINTNKTVTNFPSVELSPRGCGFLQVNCRNGG